MTDSVFLVLSTKKNVNNYYADQLFTAKSSFVTFIDKHILFWLHQRSSLINPINLDLSVLLLMNIPHDPQWYLSLFSQTKSFAR